MHLQSSHEWTWRCRVPKQWQRSHRFIQRFHGAHTGSLRKFHSYHKFKCVLNLLMTPNTDVLINAKFNAGNEYGLWQRITCVEMDDVYKSWVCSTYLWWKIKLQTVNSIIICRKWMDRVPAIFCHQSTKGPTNNWPVDGWLISSV
jgi:hypothetical protein